MPYEGLVASIGRRSGLRSRAADLDRADAVLARIIPSGSLEQIIYRVDALHRLEERGARVMNSPRAIEHEGRDLRAFVIGGRVLAAIERRSDGWRTNISRGGTACAVRLPEPLAALAVRAAAAVGAEYAGVDLLPARDGTVYVLEVNGIPGWRGLQEASGVDVADAVVQQLTMQAP